MALVHGHEPFSALQIAQETTWGTPGATFLTVPLVGSGETMRLTRDTITPPVIYGGTGAREVYEYGRSWCTGSFQVQARYDSPWLGLLLAHSLWGEQLVTDVYVDGTTIAAPNSGNTHIYQPGTTLPTGLTLKVWKAGKGPAASGWVETFAGCMVQSFTIEQRDGTALWTFNFLGKSVAVAAGSDTLVAVVGAVFQNFRDISRSGAYFKTGATLTALGIDGFTTTFDNKLVIDDAFITSPDTVDQPGRSETRAVTIEINSRLEQDYYAANKPVTEYVAAAVSKMDTLFKTGIAVGDKDYALRLEMPKIYWDADQHSLSAPGNPPTRWTATATSGSFDQAAGLPDAQTGDFRILHTCKVADDTDAKFSNFA